MEEEANGLLYAGFQSVIPSILDEGSSIDLCGDRSLHSGMGPMPCDEPESFAAYPITHPAVPLSFATVQWEVPTTPTDLPSPMTDSSSVDELSCSDGVSPDWVVNPLSMVPSTPTDSVSTDNMLPVPDGNEVKLPKSVTLSEQRTDSDQQASDSVEADLTISLMVTGDKEDLSLSADGEIRQPEEPTVEEMAPAEAEASTETSDIPESSSGHPETPGKEEKKEEEEVEEHQPLPVTITDTEQEEQELSCCTDGGSDGETLEVVDEKETMWSDLAKDEECVWWTNSSLCCDDKDTVGEPTAVTQQSTDSEEIPLSGEDERCDPDEDPTSADQMTLPEPTEAQDCLQPPGSDSDGGEDSSQPHGDHVEQEERPETGEEPQPESFSDPGETSACEEGSEGSNEGEMSEVTQLMHEAASSAPTEEVTEEPLGDTTEAERTETSQTSECVKGGDLEETDQCLEKTEALKCLVDEPEVENLEAEEQQQQQQASLDSEETEPSLCTMESEPSETEQATPQAEHTDKTLKGGLSDKTQHPEEADMEDSDMTKLIEQPDEPQGVESAETSQAEESAETNPTEQTTQAETKESTESEITDESKQAPMDQSGEAVQTDNSPEQSETKQLEEEHLETTEASQQTEGTEQPECAQSSAHKQTPTEQPASVTEGEDSLERHMEETTEQLEGQMQETGDSEEEEEEEEAVAAEPYMNGGAVDRDEARRLAEKLFRLEGIHRTDVVRHLDKDNDFSRAVGEEYLKFFDFTGQTLDQALRSFLKVVVLIGETQERERVLQCFSSRLQECNPHAFPSAGAVLTLTCAMMLLNSDLHGQNVGKAMSQSNFVSNLDGMNDGENFNKDVLKGLYNSIKNEPLEWAVDEKELQSSMMLPEDAATDPAMRSKGNPFLSVPHDKKATVFHKGFLKRKAHADIDGKRTPWGKRSWKTFYAVLKGMVLYLQKDDYSSDWHSSEEVVSVHHALAERAVDYTKRPYVFRLQTADWRVFLFEAASTEQMSSWIGRINLVSALYSSPPFPAAVGSQRKFSRPILPASQSSLPLDKQLQSHASMLQSFQEDLAALQQSLSEGRKPKARELEEYKVKEEYLQHERCRYEVYVQMLEAWGSLKRTSKSEVTADDLGLFDRQVCKDAQEEEEDEADGGMKRSHSSPSLELETAPPPIIKVRRNISERRTYRKIIIPRRNREL
ncbi:PH and SEC7 domain-containing protein 2 [Alosa sapidissima]|uniref:PH and SEC7 domain-containing protein 2 n=1 Tax=Alosa sapidissima TaxID=34773 RepID=UPI001C09209B|nr:PH and SEC7 domain-containing protein 2 [Alosa sapidissima]XP_041915606.1 PH and SEC7 domain-containing protein 2 [Alosa sapidissima]XP_041915607.1 PH and SEC7 domain-containing protein 2 [Alosa sapidissima]XP_041915608.1 PH and SEC7 domain-containing protein 2 [Alosa sapidissima]XP_041915609.1 PH and SEC7 domain-containing protein 2 [Alosa sapidissima]